jgi:alkylation response protein AidB-like acyl-CoA dehydrogenase
MYMLGIIRKYATPEQKQRWLPKLASTFSG